MTTFMTLSVSLIFCSLTVICLQMTPLCRAFVGWYSPCLMFHHLPALYDLMSGINCLLTTVAIRSSVPLSLLTLELCAHDYDISHFTYMSYICYIYSNMLNHYKMRNQHLKELVIILVFRMGIQPTGQDAMPINNGFAVQLWLWLLIQNYC